MSTSRSVQQGTPIAVDRTVTTSHLKVSGSSTQRKVFQEELQALSWQDGARGLTQHTNLGRISGVRVAGVLRQRSIPFHVVLNSFWTPSRALWARTAAPFYQHNQINCPNDHKQIEGVPIGQHPLVCRLLKGIYYNRPPQLRYTSTWRVDVVTQFLISMGNSEDLLRKCLSQKLALQMALVQASWTSELQALDLRFRVYKPKAKWCII